MGISRAQYIQGNSADGSVLSGTVQGVSAGTGITIDAGGVISVISSALPQPTIVSLGTLEVIDGVRVTYTLVRYGTVSPYMISSTTNLAVFLGGVPQLPGDAYTVGGNQVTFVSAPAVGTTFLAITAAAV